MYNLKPKYLYEAYRFALSEYEIEKEHGTWDNMKVERVDEQTGEIKKARTVYIAKQENIGSSMCIDDKEINGKSFTIMSNQSSGRIAFMMDSVQGHELAKGLKFMGEALNNIQTVNCDMAPSYLKLIREELLKAQVIIDKFHVMKYVYDAVQQVRIDIRKQVIDQLSQGQRRKKDEGLLSELEQLKKSRSCLSRSKELWSEDQTALMIELFVKFPLLKNAYDLAQQFKCWYDKKNSFKSFLQINKELYSWIELLENSKIDSFKQCSKMILKHEQEIVNYFKNPQTNARAERINGKIERFFSNGYGTKNLDFSIYRIKGYFA